MEGYPNNDYLRDHLDTITRSYKNIYAINFNYTHFFEESIRNIPDLDKWKIYYVHGKLNGKETPIISFGNTEAEEYQIIKKMGKDEAFRFLKTSYYLNHTTYRDIRQKIYTMQQVRHPYDGNVMGHSLGLTDQNLLGLLLNQEYCKNIFLYKKRESIELNKLEVSDRYDALKFALMKIISDDDVLAKLNPRDMAGEF